MSKDDNIMHGHETVAYRRHDANGDFVEKRPRDIQSLDTWLANKKSVAVVVNKLHKFNNPAYRVPQMRVGTDMVVEDFAPGDTLEKFHGKKLDFIMPAIANLLNDMSELFPVRVSDSGAIHGIESVSDVNALDVWLSDTGLRTVISDMDRELIRRAYEYIRDLPENRELVFSHNDLNDGNIIIDNNTGTVTFIDFELADFRSKFQIFDELDYLKHFCENGVAPMWTMLENLPRRNNPKLKWGFSALNMEIYYTLDNICLCMQHFFEYGGMPRGIKWARYAADRCHQLRLLMGRVAVANRAEKSPAKITMPISKEKE